MDKERGIKMAYICCYDYKTYSEDEAYEKAYEFIEEENLEEATKELFDFQRIFDALPEEMKETITERAHELVMEDWFLETEEDEEEETE